MPITIPRAGGAPTTPQISEEQRRALWEALLRAYLQRHPEKKHEEDNHDHTDR